MNRIARPSRIAVVAALTVPLALAGCSGDEKTAVSSAPSTSTSSSSSSSSSTSSTPSATSSSSSSSGSPSSTSSAKTQSPSTSTKPSTTSSPSASSTSKKLDLKLVSSCVTATSKVNGAVKQWNVAVKSGDSGQRDNAAERLGTTASDLRKLIKSSQNKDFNSRAGEVAGALEGMKKDHDDNKSVDSSALNSSSRGMLNWCSEEIAPG